MKVYYFKFFNKAVLSNTFSFYKGNEIGIFGEIDVDDEKGIFSFGEIEYRFDYFLNDKFENAFRYLNSDKFNEEFRLFEIDDFYYIFANKAENVYKKLDKYFSNKLRIELQKVYNVKNKKGIIFRLFSDKYPEESNHYIIEKENRKVKPFVIEGKLIE